MLHVEHNNVMLSAAVVKTAWVAGFDHHLWKLLTMSLQLKLHIKFRPNVEGRKV